MAPRSTRTDAIGARFARSASRCAVCLVVAVSIVDTSAALAQSSDELKAARELFQDAFKDEQAGRYPDALAKFRRVAQVKESTSVRYRIASVLAEMGRLREARDLFRALAASRGALAAADQETADSAAEKALSLDRKIPKLALRLAEGAPVDVRVTVDGAPVVVTATARVVELDPGDHLVAASVRGSPASETTVSLPESAGEVPHVIDVERRPEGGESSLPSAPATKSPVVGWVTLGGGVALVTGAAIFLGLREGAIGSIEDSCPGGVCPSSRRAAVESDRDRAELFGPVAGTLGLVGLVAIGAGVYLLARTPTSAPSTATFLAPFHQGLRLGSTF